MSIDILITIIMTAIVQSVFGTGVLLFGTPLLLILGYNFYYALIILLPTSALINFFQIKKNIYNINSQFYKKVCLLTIPFIILFLYFTNLNSININLFVGIFLIILSLKGYILIIKKIMDTLIYYEYLYLILMGIIHGLTNLGGSLLSTIVFNNNKTKNVKRATIAVCYLTFTIFQVMTLSIVFKDIEYIKFSNFIYWISGLATFFIIEKYLYIRINENRYQSFSNIFLFIIGIMLIWKI